MVQGHQYFLPIISDKGFIALSDIFSRYNIPLYCVGGAVRDSFLGIYKEDTDIDLSIPISPDKVMEVLDNHHIEYLKIGVEYGTITIIYLNKAYEITSFRQDIETDGRHATVSFGTNMVHDAQRRDFTMNALYYDYKGFLYDPIELGVQDLKSKRIIFIGDANERIKEDYLRILRYFRFLARFGLASYNKNLFKNSSLYRDGLSRLSEQRIREELTKLISYSYAIEALGFLIDLKYHHILFKNLNCNVTNLKKYVSISHDKKYLLASFFMETAEGLIKKNTLLTKKEKKKTLQFKVLFNALSSAVKTKDWLNVGMLYYEYQYDLWRDILAILAKDNTLLSKEINFIKQLKFPPFLLTGQDLLKEGHQEGKYIGITLKTLKAKFVKEFLETNFYLS